jgi:hypothetical protein
MDIYRMNPSTSGRAQNNGATYNRRGNLSVLATAEFRGGQMVSSPVMKQRYVWPNPYNQNSVSSLARKVFAR